MTKHLLTALGVALITAGCGSDPIPPTAPPPPAKKVAIDASGDTAPPPVPQTTEAAPKTETVEMPTTGRVNDESGSVVSYNPDPGLMALQPIVDQYMNYTKRNPTGFEEIIKAGYLQQLPTAPQGKKYVIDQKTFEVKLANN
ncbi:MAG: hypothetical protein AB1705_22520 [Verrucomicrobiota bacterium]